MSRPTFVTIDIKALLHNLQMLKSLAPHSKIMCMLKSNAYGHGLVAIAKALPHADKLGVACIEEGLLLQKALVKNKIILLEGLFKIDEIKKADKAQFELVVHHKKQIEFLEKYKAINPFTVWVKLETGMHRLGFAKEEVEDAINRLLACQSIKKPLNFLTHCAQSENINKLFTLKQIKQFESILKKLTMPFGARSLANSAAIINFPNAQYEWVRSGIMLYGVSPFNDKIAADFHFIPVMTFHSEIITIHHLKKGDRVGYGSSFICNKNMSIGVVACGYGDGYPRNAKNGTPVLVNGKKCVLAGRVSMDMLTIDLSENPEAKIGDPVILWGKGLPIEIIAKYSNNSPYELLTHITSRVKFSSI